MPEITTVTLKQLNALTRSELADGVNKNNSAATGTLAAKVVISQISANSVTLTNPQTQQSAQLPTSALRNLGTIKSGQTFDLLSLPNKASTYALIPTLAPKLSSSIVATGASSIPNTYLSNNSGSAQVLASTNISSNDNQLNTLVGKAAALGELGVSGKPTVNITGRISSISANQITLSFQLPKSNIPAQQVQITLTPDIVSKLQVNKLLSLTVDISGKQAKILSLTGQVITSSAVAGRGAAGQVLNAQAANAQAVGAQAATNPGSQRLDSAANTTLNISPQLAKLNAAALPNKLISAAILQQLASTQASGAITTNSNANNANVGNKANALTASSSNQASGTAQTASSQSIASTQANTSQGLNSITFPLTDAKLTQLPKALLSSLQNAISKVNTNGASQVSLRIENTPNANVLKLSVIGNINAPPLELSAKQVSSLLNTVDIRSTANIKADGNSGSNVSVNSPLINPGTKQNANSALVAAPVSSPVNKLSTTISAQGFIANRAQLVSNQAGQADSSTKSSNTSAANSASSTAAKTNAEPLIAAIKDQNLKTRVTAPQTTAANAESTIINQSAVPPIPAPQAPQSFKTDLLLEQLLKIINLAPPTSKTAQSSAAQNPSLLGQLLGQLPNSKITAALEQFAHLSSAEKTARPITIDALRSQVQNLSNQTLNQSASQSQTLSNIINALNADADIESLSPEAQTLLRSVKEQLPVSNPSQALTDARIIQQLISAPLNNPPLSAVSATAPSGMLSGLVTLLQVSLATKLQRQSNKQASKMQDQLPEVFKSIVPNVTSTQSARLMQDFRQFDAKHTLTAEVAKLLSSHQHHKLKSIESSLQGQDQLHYALPNMFHKNGDDIELLIKRESRESKDQADNGKNASWYLTMKLDVGPLGQMLAKTQLQEDEIKLQLYTSTTELKNKTLDMLPYLAKRLSALGITITEKSCQLGKIPKQLKSEHYHVFETKV